MKTNIIVLCSCSFFILSLVACLMVVIKHSRQTYPARQTIFMQECFKVGGDLIGRRTIGYEYENLECVRKIPYIN